MALTTTNVRKISDMAFASLEDRFCYTDEEREMFRKIRKSPQNYGPEMIREKIEQFVQGENGQYTAEDLKEDPAGEEKYLCVAGDNMILKAPLIVYALLFNLMKEFKLMLDKGIPLRSGDGVWYVWLNNNDYDGDIFSIPFGIEGEEVGCLDIKRILMMMKLDMEKELFTKCLESLYASQNSNKTAFITPQDIFTGNKLASEGDIYNSILQRLPVGRCDPEELWERLRLLDHEHHEWYIGTYPERIDRSKGYAVPTHLLEMMDTFMEIYGADGKMQRQLLAIGDRYLAGWLEHGSAKISPLSGRLGYERYRIGDSRKNIYFSEDVLVRDCDALARDCDAMVKRCADEEMKKMARGFWAKVALLLGADLLDVKGESFEQFMRKGLGHFEESEIEEALLEIGMHMFRSAENPWLSVDTNVWAARNVAKCVRVCGRFMEKKIVIDLGNAKWRKLMVRIMHGLLQREEDDSPFGDDYIPEFLELVDNVARFEMNAPEDGKNKLLSEIRKLLELENEELTRACLIKDLIRKEDVEAILGNLNFGRFKRMKAKKLIPLMLLKKYEAI